MYKFIVLLGKDMVYHGIIVELELYKTKRRRYVCKPVPIANFQEHARCFTA